jgi:hypothetical protein
MTATDAAFNSTTEGIAGSVATAGRAYGEHVLWLRAEDGAGNWGSTTPLVISVTPADTTFADGFESGTTSAWTSLSGASSLAITPAAATAGRYGLAIKVTGTAAAFVADGTPAAQTTYRARFTFAANGTTTPNNGIMDIFAGRNGGGTTFFRLQYRRTSSGVPQVRASVARRGGTSITAWITVADAATTLELAWASARSASVILLVNGTAAGTLSGIDTSAYTLEEVRLGPSGGLSSSMSGTEYFDHFVSDRTTPLGL